MTGESIRTCIGCGRRAPRADLVRLVFLGDGRIAVDRTKTRRGRGASVCRDERCVRSAARAGGRPWRVASVIYDSETLWRHIG